MERNETVKKAKPKTKKAVAAITEPKPIETKAKPKTKKAVAAITKPKPIETKAEPKTKKAVAGITKPKTKDKPKTTGKGVNSIMETSKMAKNVFDMQKTAFQNTYDAILTVQDQAEKAANMALDSAFWIPEEGAKALRELGKTFKQGRDEWKRCVDENFQAVEKLFVTNAK